MCNHNYPSYSLTRFLPHRIESNRKRIESNRISPPSVDQVPHVRQVANWDCGLACVLMVLRALGRRGLRLMDLHHLAGTTRCPPPSLHPYHPPSLPPLDLHATTLFYLFLFCGDGSIWTIDLAYLLRHFSLNVCFFTVTLGANPSFALETFYKVCTSPSSPTAAIKPGCRGYS